MSEIKDKQQDEKHLQPISRREFALGSAALLGAYSIAEASELSPLSPEVQAWKLEKSNEVKELMEARHILDDDLKRVIDTAEKTRQKLYQPENDRLLAKLRIQAAYFYAEYSPIKEGYRIHAAYSHRFLYTGDQK
jgi:hypothetical protein